MLVEVLIFFYVIASLERVWGVKGRKREGDAPARFIRMLVVSLCFVLVLFAASEASDGQQSESAASLRARKEKE